MSEEISFSEVVDLLLISEAFDLNLVIGAILEGKKSKKKPIVSPEERVVKNILRLSRKEAQSQTEIDTTTKVIPSKKVYNRERTKRERRRERSDIFDDLNLASALRRNSAQRKSNQYRFPSSPEERAHARNVMPSDKDVQGEPPSRLS